MTLDALTEAFAALPSHGWAKEPSPVTALPALAKQLGLASLQVKRDDLLSGLHGGNKVRKLDVLLATAPFREAKTWASLGALGSGHLAAATAAAAALGRTLEVHTFFEPLSQGVLENLAFVASGPTRLHYYRSRVALALRRPALLTGGEVEGAALIPAGGTAAPSVAGVARAGLEVARQLERGELSPFDALYVALGTGGTAAGLALGLGLAGVKVPVYAVAVVERPFTTARRVRRLIALAARWLRQHRVAAQAADAAPVRVVRGQLGPGYGVPTAQSLAAVEVLREEGVPAEPIYTGKAFAGLLARAHASRGQRVLYWSTVRRGPLPAAADWRDRLPERLREALAPRGARVGRRVVLAGGLAGAAALAVARVTGYPPVPGWAGAVLARWEALVLAAAAQVLSGVPEVEGLTVAANVDRFLVPMPPKMKGEVHQLLALVEHGTTPLGLRLSRFTRLDAAGREAYLLSLDLRGWLLAQAFRGLRDLVLMGVYQDARAWPGLGYQGPWPAGTTGPESSAVPYESFRAAPGALPKGGARG